MTRPDGTPVNAVYGFTTMLLKMLRETDADHLAVVFDAARHTFRNDLYPGYKAHRPEPPPELVPQFALIRDAVRAFNVACVESPGYEADDLIATYSRLAETAGATVTIVSSDKDLMQLVGEGIRMLDPVSGRPIGPEQVRERFGVAPEKVVDVQALVGDATDNVPGVPGIGVKTAAQLITEYGSLDALLARAHEIKQPKRRQALIDHADDARLSRDLVRLRDDVPPPVPLAAFAVRDPDRTTVLRFLEAQAFRSLILRLDTPPAPAAGAAPPAAAGGQPADAGYELVQTEADLVRWIEAARLQGFVAVDTETTSLDAIRAELVGVSLALAPGRACYVPVAHLAAEAGDAPGQIARARAVELLKPLLEDPAVLKIGQNVKYDSEVLARYGVTLAPIDDTMLLSYVLEGGLHGHGMDELAKLHLGHKTITFAEVAGSGKAQVTFDRVPLDKALQYAAEDADVTLRLHRALKPRLLAERLVSVYDGAAAGAGAGGDGTRRHSRRCRGAAAAERRIRGAARRAGRGDSPACRPAVQYRLAEATGRGAVRRHGPRRRQAQQDRRLRHRRRGSGDIGRRGPPAAGKGARLAAAGQVEEHLCRCPGAADQSRDRACAHLVPAGRGQHRPVVVVRS
jgi:DNA polymerase-1